VPGRVKSFVLALAVFGLFVVVFSLSFSRAIRAGSNHDEHQFIASAELLADQGLLPYRDYPYFHLPNLVFVYGLLYSFTEFKLLTARLISAVCVTAAAGLLYLFSLSSFRKLSLPAGHWVGAGSVLLFVASPLIAYTGTFAWNHNLAMLLALLAFLLHWQGPRRERPGLWIFFSGLCLGLAIGTRLSFASALVPFAAVLYFYPGPHSPVGVFKRLGIFGAGLLISLVPVLLLFVAAPQQFIFGNFTYASLNTFYREEAGFFGPPNPMTNAEKFFYFWDFVLPQPGNLLSLVAILFLGFTPLLAEVWQHKGSLFEPVFLLLMAPFVAWGALLPSPAWYQYYAAPLPFAIAAVVYGIAVLIRRHPPGRAWVVALFLQLVLIASLYQTNDYRRITFLLHPEAWWPLKVHDLGVQVAELSAGEDVLTLAPIYPLEGGASIYPEFATGPFAWRTASLLAPAERAALSLVSDQALEKFLENRPPGAILVGFEHTLEGAFNDYALAHKYHWVGLGSETGLWLHPQLTLP
jgi:hypothetical protein